ncbi:DUF6777 domain-containing protein [Actinomycetospora atypica]|uniref:DUF6777 domain-containing protein n=1 Tax=Actinomycetospora atypica TaxID=1290095 RepID=A0ABV9YH79_9PSEU
MRADQHPYPRFPVAHPTAARPPYGPGVPHQPMPPHHGHPFPQPPIDQPFPEALRGPRAPGQRRPTWRLKVGAATAIVAVSAVAWVGLSGSADAGTAQVQLESVSSAGAMPFTAPVGDDVQNVASPENAAGPQAGNTGGLYAQDPAAPACDTQALIAQLTADPAKAAAWGRPLNVEPNGIGAYVTSLTTVTLRADIAVTEYGFSQGAFQPYPAVLQAGTAVMVNSYGEPTVKCQNGNPLGAATSSNDTGTVVGTAWSGFTAERTIRVTPAPAPQRTLTVVSPGTNAPAPAPVKTQPGPNTPNPAPATNPQGQLALTATRNYNGTIRLSDGRILDKNGDVIKPEVDVKHPPNSRTFPDGAVQHPDGKIFNINGTERLPVKSNIPGLGDVTINANGTISPAKPGRVVQWNFDGTFTVFRPGSTSPVLTIGRDGTVKSTVPVPTGSVVQPDGSVIDPVTGQVKNPDGSTRTPTTVPGVGTIGTDGGVTPEAGTKGNVNALVENKDAAQNGGVDGNALAGKGLAFKADGTVDTTKLPEGAVVDAKGNVTLLDGTVLNPDGSIRTSGQGPTNLPDGAVLNPDGTTTLPDGTVLNQDGIAQKPATPQGGIDGRVCGTGVIAETCPTDTDPSPVQPQVEQAPAGTSTDGGSTTGGSSEGSSSEGSSSTGSSSESGSASGGEAQGDAG